MEDEQLPNSNTEETMEDELERQRRERQQRQQNESEVKKETRKWVEEQIREATKKGVNTAKNALFNSVTATTGTIIFGTIIVLFLLIGIISFILTMPGLTQERIFQEIAGRIEGTVAFFKGASKENSVNTEDVKTATIEALNHLNEMGLDPVGLGFVHSVTKDETGKINSYQEDSDSFLKSITLTGDVKDAIVTKVPIVSPLATYIWSNEKTYLPEQYYVKLNKVTDVEFIDYFSLAGLVSSGNFLNNITDFIGDFYRKIIANEFGNYLEMNDGMLKIIKSPLENEPIFDRVNLTIDRENKILNGEYTNIEGLNAYDQSYSIDLDSWIGRYGKSLELLTALHIATMSSGLTEELVTNEDLQTKVEIAFENATYDLDYKIEIENEDKTKTELPITFGNMDADNDIYDKVFQNFDPVTFEYKGNLSGLELSDITICSLNNLVDTLQANINTSTEQAEEQVKNYQIHMKEAIESITNSVEPFYVKYDIQNWNVNNEYLDAYIGKKGTGLLKNGNIVNYQSEKDYNFKGNKDSDYLGNGIVEYTINVSEDGSNESTKSIIQIKGLSYYKEHIEELTPEVIDAITAMLIQVDTYTSNHYIPKDFIDVDFNEKNVSYTIGEETYQIYKSNINSFNLYSDTDSSELQLKLYFTHKWIQMRDSNNFTQESLTELYNEIYTTCSSSTNEDYFIDKIIADIWYDVVAPNKEVKAITATQINTIYDTISEFTLGVKDMKIAQPRIMSVTNHWYKDLDFSNAYSPTTKIEERSIGQNEGIVITAQLKNTLHSTQTSQPYVIKGDVVTLDGVIQDETEYQKDEKYGKGFEASKKIFTSGQYYVYDGSEETSKGIYYNQLLENIKPGNMVEVRVSALGKIMYIKAVKYNKGIDSKKFIDDSGNVIATVYGTNSLTWQIEGEQKALTETKCKTILFDEAIRDSDKSTISYYYVYIPESIQYISATEDITQSKESVEKINELLTAIGVTSLRQPISFDNTTSTGDVATLTAFSILEGMKSTSSQQIYRDLKEFLIELGYYSKAEFDYLTTNVLTWFIPEYIPKDPVNWKENKNEDAGVYGAVLYPAEVEEDAGNSDGTSNEETEGSSNEGAEGSNNEENKGTDNNVATEDTQENNVTQDENNITTENEDKATGFTAGLEVVAPGNCKIIKYEVNTEKPEESFIILEFDGISQPEIAMLDRYTMTIMGIDIAETIKDPDSEDEDDLGVGIDTLINEETVIKVNSILGYTSTYKIQVILQNANGAYLSNVEDYMAPELNFYTSDISTELAYFYWMPYESNDPGIVSGRNGNEVAVGISQWTTLNKGNPYNNISSICEKLYNKNPVLCAELKTFINWTVQDIMNDYFNGGNQLKNAFRTVAERDREAFLHLQMQCVIEERTELIRKQGVEWLLDRNPVTVGTYFSLSIWAPYAGWENKINPAMTDEQIVKALLRYACTRNSTAGSLNGRWESQARLAVDLINGTFTDLEIWIETKQPSIYGEGANSGYLD